MKEEVRQAWEDRAVAAQGKIWDDLEPQLTRRSYELEIAQRLLSKAQDEAAREIWQTQVDVLGMLVVMTEGDLAEQQEEVALCEAMIAESKRTWGGNPGALRQRKPHLDRIKIQAADRLSLSTGRVAPW